MTAETLTKKPLVEAIFQLRWRLQADESGLLHDPHYRILIGSLYDKVRDRYPYHEELPTADMPDEIAAYVVQHRFRTGEQQWPLIQLGPGILSVNETEKYLWRDFEDCVGSAVTALYASYPPGEELETEALTLRYIDAVALDDPQQNALDFLKQYLKTSITLDPQLFADTGVGGKPTHLDLRFSFASDSPAGSVHLRFSLGQRNAEDLLIWETVVESTGEETASAHEDICRWLLAAHEVTHDWFFKLIEGDLRERFA